MYARGAVLSSALFLPLLRKAIPKAARPNELVRTGVAFFKRYKKDPPDRIVGGIFFIDT
jgi:hypothetical protein